MTAPLRFGLVGAGAIAQAYAQAFHASGLASLVAVADTRQDVAAAMAEGFGCASFESHEALADRGDCEAVVVCTPPNAHPDICTDLLGRKLHVLCEKPLSIDAAAARRMVAAAEQSGALFTMASKFRCVDDVIRAKSIMTSGILGDIILFENAFTARVDMSRRWNAQAEISGGGVLIDNGTHSLDLVRYFLGPIAEVQAVEGKRVQGLDVEETVQIFSRSHSGVMGTIDLSWSLNKERDTYIEIYGSEGTVKIGWKESRYRQSTSQDWVVFGHGYDKVQAFGKQIDNFVRSIRGEEVLLITGHDGIASVEVVEAAYRALKSTEWVQVASTNGSVSAPPVRVSTEA